MHLQSITKEEAFNRGLPKWPQMLVTGTPVTVEQAKEIIFATDTSLTSTWGGGGNDREFQYWLQEITGYNKINMNWRDIDYSKMSEEEKARQQDYYNRWGLSQLALSERAGFLDTNYVNNSWASSSFIFGPHGWCHPTGMISFIDNVGKWPSVNDVFEDWVKIAKRWKFLNIYVTLMSGEGCEEDSQPIVTFYVHDGIVETFEGTVEPHKNKPLRRNFGVELNFGIMHGNTQSEQGLPRFWIEEFAKKVRPIVDELVVEFKL